jgi:anti-sigma factor ChrR (cupin superfamily)
MDVMKAITGGDRVVANIHRADYQAYRPGDAAYAGVEVLQLDGTWPFGLGFFILKMQAGSSSRAHEHTANEQFLVLEGELIDHDGTVYRSGDFVLLKKGTRHRSHTPGGCLLAVFIPEELNHSEG